MSDTYTEFGPLVYDRDAIKQQGWGMAAAGATDDKLIVGFYKRSVLNQARSRDEGKPVYEGKDYVKISHPGETQNVVDRPVREDDQRRWPRHWHLYQQGVRQTPDGVPLSLLFPAKPEIESTLRGYNIHTVEQLAGLSAQGISTVGMGAQDWVNAAKRYMEQANKGVNHHQFEKAIAEKDAQIAALTRQVAEVTALVQQQQSRNFNAGATSNYANAGATSNYDFQTAQINTTHQSSTEPFTPGPAEFVQDLSGQVQPQRRGPGRPRKSQES